MTTPWSPVEFFNTAGTAPVVLVCEHASALFPDDFGDMGLSQQAATSHAAWDIGALKTARHIAQFLDAPLVSGGASRLLYDCNRPFEARDSIPEKSEVYDIPGNKSLSDQTRIERFELIHQPFHTSAASLVSAHASRFDGPIAVVTIHSFTPVYNGVKREVDLGFLYHEDAEISEKMVEVESERGTYLAALNVPYSSNDGVTHTLKMHGDDNGFQGAMIEIRNDLIATDEGAKTLGLHLAESLKTVLADLKIGGASWS